MIVKRYVRSARMFRTLKSKVHSYQQANLNGQSCTLMLNTIIG